MSFTNDLNQGGYVMFTINKIVVPIESFSSSNRLVDYAHFYGQQFGASLTFVHVLENPVGLYEGFAAVDFEAELIEHVEENMRQFVSEQNKLGRDCEGVVLHGSAPREIVDYAKTNGFDLIIMGSHRYNVIEKFILGSVAEKVAHKAPCPVVIFNGQGD